MYDIEYNHMQKIDWHIYIYIYQNLLGIYMCHILHTGPCRTSVPCQVLQAKLEDWRGDMAVEQLVFWSYSDLCLHVGKFHAVMLYLSKMFKCLWATFAEMIEIPQCFCKYIQLYVQLTCLAMRSLARKSSSSLKLLVWMTAMKGEQPGAQCSRPWTNLTTKKTDPSLSNISLFVVLNQFLIFHAWFYFVVFYNDWFNNHLRKTTLYEPFRSSTCTTRSKSVMLRMDHYKD